MYVCMYVCMCESKKQTFIEHQYIQELPRCYYKHIYCMYAGCMYVFMYVCTVCVKHTYVCKCVRTCMYVCTYVCVCVKPNYVRTCMYVCMCKTQYMDVTEHIIYENA